MSGRVRDLSPEFVDSFPQQLRPGVLYVSMKFATCGHLCCCGCGEEVITPLSPAQWRLSYNGEEISLHPSIGNWSLECNSHYWIDQNKVRWSHGLSRDQIDESVRLDRADLEAGTRQATVVSRLRKLLRRRDR